jgi:RimJ/RimL family protein N-acetyltransferase
MLLGRTMIGPTLTTERLILRPPTRDDFPGWCALHADPEAARYIGGVQPASGAWRALATMTGSWVLQGFSMFSVIERRTNRWMGRLGPWRPEGWPGPEVGWALQREFWGQGFAREGATAALNWAFDTLGWDEVLHIIAPANAPSIKLAEALGATRRGPVKMPPPFADAACDAWGQSRAQWRERQASTLRGSP